MAFAFAVQETKHLQGTTIAGDLSNSDMVSLLFNNTGSSTGTLTLKSSNNFGFIWRNEFNTTVTNGTWFGSYWNYSCVSSSCIAGTWLELADTGTMLQTGVMVLLSICS
jgi:hypothetical protein